MPADFTEQRKTPRFPANIKGRFTYNGIEHDCETKDISAGGAYLRSRTLPPQGEIIQISLFIPKVDKSGNKVYIQVSTICKIVRTMIYPSESSSETGFAVRWLEASSKDDMTPLKDFIKPILGIARGFFQVIRDNIDESTKTFRFRFPEADQIILDKAIYEKRLGKAIDSQSAKAETKSPTPASVPTQSSTPQKIVSISGKNDQMKLPIPAPAPQIPESEEGEEEGIDATIAMPSPFHVSEIVLSEQKEKPRKTMTGLYLVLPLVYILDGKELAGNAIKISDTGLRIDTDQQLPPVYKRIQIKISFMSKKKKNILSINGTVTIVKQHTGDRTQGGIFEVELTLVNDPKTLGLYRKIIDHVKTSLESG